MKIKKTIACLAALLCIIPAGAQRYKAIDKSIAVVSNITHIFFIAVFSPDQQFP